MWRFLCFDNIDGFYSAALFEAVGRHVGSGLSPETILFWRVRSPVVYLGYHQCVEDEVNDGFCRSNNIGVVRRILGGGCGFCDNDQILFSVIGKEGSVIPDDIQDAYNKVLRGVVLALFSLEISGEIEPSRNAVYAKGRKISGNAQGRFDGAVLVNGSLLIDFDFELMDKVMKNPTKNLKPVANARDGMITLKEMGITDIIEIITALREGFERALGVKSQDGALTGSELDMAYRLLEKYTQKEWTYRMDIKRALRKKHAALLPQPSG
ncbi:MAG: lipoate--protein ligase family protein [Candidatus Methanoperedens sp.]|nr:lipoate--protein ligase family protein [Candidatus Methanoperedens sp.]